MNFSKILEKARPNVALTVNLWNFSKILLNSNHDTTEYDSFTNKNQAFGEISLKGLTEYELV